MYEPASLADRSWKGRVISLSRQKEKGKRLPSAGGVITSTSGSASGGEHGPKPWGAEAQKHLRMLEEGMLE